MEKRLSPLKQFIKVRRPAELRLSLGEIEEIIGGRLPASASMPRWWAGPTELGLDGHQRVWQDLGYSAIMSGFALIVTFRPLGERASRSLTVANLKEMVFPSTPRRGLVRQRIWRPDLAPKRRQR